MGYYLFMRKESDLGAYRKEFDRVSKAMDEGKTPVTSELRWAKTSLAESVPYNILNGALLVLGTAALSSIRISEILKVAIVLVVNNFFGALSNFAFVNVKHRLRVRLCARLGVEPCEKSIAVMESLEYQSV